MHEAQEAPRGSWRANATGRNNRCRAAPPPRRRQDDDDAFDGLDALAKRPSSAVTDSLSSEQFVLDLPDASSVEPGPSSPSRRLRRCDNQPMAWQFEH